MNWHHKARKVLITGASDTGKTTLWLRMLRDWPARWKWVFDSDREAAGKLGWPVGTAVNQLEWSGTQVRPLAWDSHAMFPGERERGFSFFCSWVMAFVSLRGEKDRPLVNGPKLVAVDELQNFTMPGKGGVPQSFRVMLDAGRREEVDLLLVSQALNEVHQAVRRQLTDIYSFQHRDPLALEWLAARGLDPAQVVALPPRGAFLHLDCRTRQITNGHSPHSLNAPTASGD